MKNAHFRFLAVACLNLILVGALSTTQAQQRAKSSQSASSAAVGIVEEGYRLAEKNKWPEAIETFKRAIRADARYAEAYGGLGDAYLNSGNWEGALVAYKEAVRIAPSDPVAQYNLGYCYNTMGRHGEAFAPLVKATILAPAFAEAFYGIGYAYLRGSQYEKSISFLRSAIRLNPNYAEAYYGLALVYTRLGKLDLAEAPRRSLMALDANMVVKLDREIRTPPQALAGPLPVFTPAPTPKEPGEPERATDGPRRIEPPVKHAALTAAATREVVPQGRGAVENASEQKSPPPVTPEVGKVDSSSPPVQPIAQDLPKQETIATSSSVVTSPNVSRSEPPAATPSEPAPGRLAATGISAWPDNTKRWALVIGVDNYSEQQISKLSGGANDARALALALVQNAGFPATQVILLASDQPPQLQPRRSTILRYLSNMRGQIPKDGLLLFSFAGHSIERGGQSYLLPSDALAIDDPSLLEDTAVNVNRVKELIRAAGVTQVLLVLDAWRNDPTPSRSNADNPMSLSFSKSFGLELDNRALAAFATLYATGVGQRAYEYGVKKQGYFTSVLIDGLAGHAANDKGEVTLGNLLRYIQENVPKFVQRDLGPDKQQTPLAILNGYKADELVITATKKTTP
ncbi:MAG TPA: tetratricopeptide repeat protein [Pyrinomonadaceae bacterium]|nr:tetratricopeptide repeat protein [Pyrinomonadaceae bacterium]